MSLKTICRQHSGKFLFLVAPKTMPLKAFSFFGNLETLWVGKPFPKKEKAFKGVAPKTRTFRCDV